MKTFTLIFPIAIAFIARCHAMNALKDFRTYLTANNIYLQLYFISHIMPLGFFIFSFFSFLFSVSMEFWCSFSLSVRNIFWSIVLLHVQCVRLADCRSLTKSAKSWNGRLSCRGGTSSNHIDKPSKHATSNRISFTKQVKYARFILESIAIQ